MSSRAATNSNQDTRSSSHVGFGSSFILRASNRQLRFCAYFRRIKRVKSTRSSAAAGQVSQSVEKNVMEHLNSHIKQAYLRHTDDNASSPLARSAWSEGVNTTLGAILRVCGPDRWGKLKAARCKQLMFQQDVFSNHWKGNNKQVSFFLFTARITKSFKDLHFETDKSYSSAP